MNIFEKKPTPFMDELKSLDEESYIDIMNALKEKVDNDIIIPDVVKKKTNKIMVDLFELLIDYSA